MFMNMNGPGDIETDGRRLRSQASRERIIDAVVALVEEGHGILAAETVAERAQVGLRSLFRHFGDMATLYAAVLGRLGQRFIHLQRPYEATDWPGRVRESLGRRMQVYEGGLPFTRTFNAHRDASPTMARGPSVFNQMLRARLESVVPAEVRADELWFEQLDLWLSLDCYASLRERSGLDHATAARVIGHAVDRLLAEKA